MLDLSAAVLIWGLSFALAKKVLVNFTPFELVAFRLTTGAITAFILNRAFPGKKYERESERKAGSRTSLWTPAFIVGLFEFAGTYLLFTWSLSYLPSGVVGSLTLLTPAFTFICGCLFRIHSPTWRGLGAVALSFVGASLCFPVTQIFSNLQWSGGAFLGFVLVTVSNISFALGTVFITKWERAGVWSQNLTVRALGSGAMVGVVVALLTPRSPLDHFTNAHSWLLPLYLGVVSTGLGFFLWNRGVQKVSALPASLVGNFKGPLSVFWGFILLNESFNFEFFVGLALLFISTQIISWRPAVKS